MFQSLADVLLKGILLNHFVWANEYQFLYQQYSVQNKIFKIILIESSKGISLQNLPQNKEQ